MNKEERYKGAKWKMSFSEDTIGRERSDDPTLEEISHFLKKLEKEYPDKVSVETIGKSVGGNDIFLVIVTDKNVSDENKQIPFFIGCEHGNEHSATTCLLNVLKWLVTPGADKIIRSQKILIVPCVNPDGYETLHFDNMNGVNLYADYSLTGKPTQPESQAVWKVMEKYQPEAFGSCHGTWKKVKYAAIENCQGSYGTSRYDRTHSRLFAEEVNKECEKAGYPQDRMEEDSERILPVLPGFGNHSFRSGSGITPGVYVYNRFHSLIFSMEIMYEESGLIKIKKILELGNKPWRYELLPGYPVRVISPPEPFSIVAYGTNVLEQRKSRVELWQSNDRITKYLLGEEEGFMSFGFSILPEDRDFICEYVSEFLDHFSSDRNIDVESIRGVFGHNRLKRWWSKYFEPPSINSIPLPEIKNGISLRIRLLPGSKVKRVLINGRKAYVSEKEGYQVWTPKNSYTFLQINIPPGKSIAAPNKKLTRVICTVEYKPGKLGKRK